MYSITHHEKDNLGSWRTWSDLLQPHTAKNLIVCYCLVDVTSNAAVWGRTSKNVRSWRTWPGALQPLTAKSIAVCCCFLLSKRARSGYYIVIVATNAAVWGRASQNDRIKTKFGIVVKKLSMGNDDTHADAQWASCGSNPPDLMPLLLSPVLLVRRIVFPEVFSGFPSCSGDDSYAIPAFAPSRFLTSIALLRKSFRRENSSSCNLF